MKNCGAIFCLLIIFGALVSGTGGAQSNSTDVLPRGVVVEKVACRNDAARTYSLYLPSNYTPEKKWPILYAFDPFARGKIPVEIFREAAEQFGFILVGSNDSRNNVSGEKLSEIITAMWTDTHARLRLDDQRAYAVGLSGGARVATYFAASCRGCLAGVVVCGATFPPKFPLDKPPPFSIFGTTGVDDFNYPELVRTFATLNKIGATNHLAVFDGGHQWLPKDLTFDALAWMNLQAMKSGRLALDEKFVEDLLIKRTNQAEALWRQGDLVGAARLYETMIADFKNVSDTHAAFEKLSEVRGQKSYRKLADEEKDSFDEQQRTAGKIIASGAELLDASGESAALKRIAGELEIWLERAKAPADSVKRRLARRILDQIFVEAYEAALYVNERQKDYAMMIAYLELTRLISPQNSNVLLELSRAFALGKRKQDALDALGQAVKNGFADCSRLTNQPEWKNLRGTQEFQNVIKRMNCVDVGR